jgi:aromatic-amino-acid transaminase
MMTNQASPDQRTMSTSPLSSVEMAPSDPILGLTELFNADKNESKVNLGVGVYYDDSGKVPLLECVRQAEQQLAAAAKPRAYLPIDGGKATRLFADRRSRNL